MAGRDRLGVRSYARAGASEPPTLGKKARKGQKRFVMASTTREQYGSVGPGLRRRAKTRGMRETKELRRLQNAKGKENEEQKTKSINPPRRTREVQMHHPTRPIASNPQPGIWTDDAARPAGVFILPTASQCLSRAHRCLFGRPVASKL